jgi:hypothetical protein
MKLIAFSVLLSFYLISFSQERKIKTKKSDYYIEIYSINKETKKKDGDYIKINKSTKDTLIIGYYKNDTKVGKWKFNKSHNRNYIIYDYDSAVFCLKPRKIEKIDSFYIKKDTAFILTKVDSPPIYISYDSEIKDILRQSSSIPIDIAEKNIEGTSMASILIDKNGEISNIQIEKSLSKGLDKNIIATLKLINGDWKPAILNGLPVESKVYFLYNISQLVILTKYIEEPYLYVIDLINYGVINSTKKGY